MKVLVLPPQDALPGTRIPNSPQTQTYLEEQGWLISSYYGHPASDLRTCSPRNQSQILLLNNRYRFISSRICPVPLVRTQRSPSDGHGSRSHPARVIMERVTNDSSLLVLYLLPENFPGCSLVLGLKEIENRARFLLLFQRQAVAIPRTYLLLCLTKFARFHAFMKYIQPHLRLCSNMFPTYRETVDGGRTG